MKPETKPQRLLICGDRNWTDPKPIENELRTWPTSTIIIHGAARGADSIAGDLAQSLWMSVESYPAQWDIYGKSAGAIRNRLMLSQGKPDFVVAFHDHIDQSKGTKDMLLLVKKASIKWKLVRHVTEEEK